MSNDWNILPFLKVGLVSLLSVMLLVIDNPMHMVNKTMQSLLEANLKFNPKGQHLYSLWYGSGFRVAAANAQNISVNRFGKGTIEMVSFEVISKERRILKYLCNYWWRWSYRRTVHTYASVVMGYFPFYFSFLSQLGVLTVTIYYQKLSIRDPGTAPLFLIFCEKMFT